MEKNFRSFAGQPVPVRKEEESVQQEKGEDYSRYIENLRESIEDRKELTERLARLVSEIDSDYSREGRKSLDDMQQLAEKEAAIRLVEKRVTRLTDHIKSYIDYFYKDPCPSDDPLSWGN